MAANRPLIPNRLLAALPLREYRRLLAGLEPVTLTSGEVIYEVGKPIRHVYFPCDSLVSLLTPVDGHMALEVGLIGREGMLGIPLALGVNESPALAVVQGSGTALRMTSGRFSSEHGRHGLLHAALDLYIHERLVQITQIAACNRFHLVEDRLARRLLMTRDRMGSNDFHITQEILGNMLGVLRVAVTKAASALQRRKLIRYRRGDISILDAAGLEAAACRCYQVVKKIYGGAENGHSGRRKPLAAAAA
jgi:CRP-like cAMP-binding protein